MEEKTYEEVAITEGSPVLILENQTCPGEVNVLGQVVRALADGSILVTYPSRSTMAAMTAKFHSSDLMAATPHNLRLAADAREAEAAQLRKLANLLEGR